MHIQGLNPQNINPFQKHLQAAKAHLLWTFYSIFFVLIILFFV